MYWSAPFTFFFSFVFFLRKIIYYLSEKDYLQSIDEEYKLQ